MIPYEETRSDVVLVGQTRDGAGQGGSLTVSLLLEHKHKPDRLASLQVLDYMVRMHQHHLRQGQPLGPIIAVLVYHGTGRWTTARTIDELLAGPRTLRRFHPHFDLPMLDLSRVPDDQMPHSPLLRAGLLLLKYVDAPDFGDRVVRIIPEAVADTTNALRLQWLRAALTYARLASSQFREEQLRQLVSNLRDPESRDFTMTLTEELHLKGKAEGKMEGIAEGRQEGVLVGQIQQCQKMLHRPMTATEDLFQLPIEQLRAMVDRLETDIAKR